MRPDFALFPAIRVIQSPTRLRAARLPRALWMFALAFVGFCASAQTPPPLARISPDYCGIAVPTNIAPLNFKILEPGDRFEVRLRGVKGTPIEIKTGDPGIRIPAAPWRALLAANAGEWYSMEIRVREGASDWKTFQPVTNLVSKDPIDPWLAYRVIRPIYNIYINVDVYQRNLASFEKKPILSNNTFSNGCVNCHTFLDRDPNTMAIHIRGENTGNAMLLACGGSVAKVARTAGYMSWHPSGRAIAYATSKLSLVFHTTGETRDVFDDGSDIGLIRLDKNTVEFPPGLVRTNRAETWPSWSPDGHWLYYCSAPVLPVEREKEVRYDLMRVSFNIDTGAWGDPETLVPANQTGLSASQPRVSPDNRFVLFCLSKWGHFPIYQPSCDLYLYDISAHSVSRLDINSSEADTWHCWSSNGRWIVFSSKRMDGEFARPFFAWFDGAGGFTKPFVLPQEDPGFYDSFTRTINVPEFIKGPVPYSEEDLTGAILHPQKTLTPAVISGSADPGPSVGENSQAPAKVKY